MELYKGVLHRRSVAQQPAAHSPQRELSMPALPVPVLLALTLTLIPADLPRGDRHADARTVRAWDMARLTEADAWQLEGRRVLYLAELDSQPEEYDDGATVGYDCAGPDREHRSIYLPVMLEVRQVPGACSRFPRRASPPKCGRAVSAQAAPTYRPWSSPAPPGAVRMDLPQGPVRDPHCARPSLSGIRLGFALPLQRRLGKIDAQTPSTQPNQRRFPCEQPLSLLTLQRYAPTPIRRNHW
jgi:hypothetical protein